MRVALYPENTIVSVSLHSATRKKFYCNIQRGEDAHHDVCRIESMKIGILDDNSDDLAWVAEMLTSAGHEHELFASAQALLRALRTTSYDALIVDWNLPDHSGVETISRIRNELLLTVPIIMVTARSDDSETVEGLRAGADDYITKPARSEVLLARLQAVTRRSGPLMDSNSVYQVGALRIDVDRHLISRDGEPLPLADREFMLFVALFRHLGRAVSRDYLFQTVWGHVVALESRTLDVHISRVRSKLKLTPEFGWRLATVYGYGYRLETMPE
jgi:DNA-binding response OmpR family regulator